MIFRKVCVQGSKLNSRMLLPYGARKLDVDRD